MQMFEKYRSQLYVIRHMIYRKQRRKIARMYFDTLACNISLK